MNDCSSIDMSRFLPHRPPFLMVDKVLKLDDQRVTASFKILKKSVFVKEGRFLEEGLVEFAAQTCSAIVGQNFFDDDDSSGDRIKLIGFISSIKQLSIFSTPVIGSELIARAQLESTFDGGNYIISTMSCDIFEGEKKLLSCELNLFIQEEKYMS